MESLYRKVGFAVCFLVLVLVIIIAMALMKDVLMGSNKVQVRFPQVGTLILQEPVSMAGVQVGEVARIKYNRNTDSAEIGSSGHALVTLEFYRRISIPKDSKFINFNHSMMGARMIFLERGTSPENMDFTQVQVGVFEDGISEMMKRTAEVLDLVKKYKQIIDVLNQGADSSESVVEFYQKSLKPFFLNFKDRIDQLKKIEAEVQEKSQWALERSGKLKEATTTLAVKFPDMLAKTDNYLKSIGKTIIKMDSLITKTQEIIERLEHEKTLTHKLLYEKELFDTLKDLNLNLKNLIRFIKGGGISEIVEFWRNIHIWGKNPTKSNKSP